MVTEQPHPQPDLHLLTERLLGILEPLVEAGVALASSAQGSAPGKCQQVWCPVCAVVAVAAGEQHPLTTVLATHGANLLPLLRDLLDTSASATPDSTDVDDRLRDGPGHYQHIEITVHDT